jgi:RNA polymerase sigma factor (sigma-70 family)
MEERQMKNFTDSDYALNKYSGGIVYRFADGIMEVTLSDFLAENPDKTEADFLALKELSDTIYLDQVKAENAQTKKNSAYNEMSAVAKRYAPSPEETLIGEMDEREEAEWHEQRIETSNRAINTLTDIQRRRYLMYHVEGLTLRQIAEIEGTNHKTVLESLQASEKKIKKVLENS